MGVDRYQIQIWKEKSIHFAAFGLHKQI